jgi:hypothetical protein
MIKFVDEDEDDGNEVEREQARNDVTNTYDVTNINEVTPQNIFANFKVNGKNNCNNGDYKSELYSNEDDENHPGAETEIIKRFFN